MLSCIFSIVNITSSAPYSGDVLLRDNIGQHTVFCNLFDSNSCNAFCNVSYSFCIWCCVIDCSDNNCSESNIVFSNKWKSVSFM